MADRKLEQIMADCREVLSYEQLPGSTHSHECWRWHLGCFARRVQAILEGKEPDD